MKKLFRVAIIIAVVLIGSIFTACKENFSIYIFSSEGGVVSYNGETISNKKILSFDDDTDISLTAIADTGYEFKHWLINNDINSTKLTLNITVKKEMVIKAVFDIKSSSSTPTDPTEPTDPTNPVDPTDPIEPSQPDEPQTCAIIFDLDLYSGQSVNIQTSATQLSDGKYSCPINSTFEFSLTNADNLASKSKLLVFLGEQKNAILNKNTQGKYVVTITNETSVQITIKQVATITFNINYGVVGIEEYENYIDSDTTMDYYIDTELSYDEIKLNKTLLFEELANQVVRYANNSLTIDDYRVGQIQIGEVVFSVAYVGDTPQIAIQSGTITNNLFASEMTLIWE